MIFYQLLLTSISSNEWEPPDNIYDGGSSQFNFEKGCFFLLIAIIVLLIILILVIAFKKHENK